MEVDAPVWYWTPHGMRQQLSIAQLSTDHTRYITVEDAERLLEEAHARGYRQACEDDGMVDRGSKT